MALIIDRRRGQEICRACGEKHDKPSTYNMPTVDCIKAMRLRIDALVQQLGKGIKAEAREGGKATS